MVREDISELRTYNFRPTYALPLRALWGHRRRVSHYGHSKKKHTSQTTSALHNKCVCCVEKCECHIQPPQPIPPPTTIHISYLSISDAPHRNMRILSLMLRCGAKKSLQYHITLGFQVLGFQQYVTHKLYKMYAVHGTNNEAGMKFCSHAAAMP